MGCSYFENKGGLFGFSAYCHKKGDYVNDDAYDSYCKGYYYSDCPIYKGSSSSGGCYLTSACVFAKGLPDNCYELETLRKYRDTWLKKTEKGRLLIKEYYEIAPKIVSSINELDDRKAIYSKIYREMVLPCVALIEKKKFEEALELYKNMTIHLQKQYC